MSKELKFGKDSREAILEGAGIIFDAVKVTYGAAGRNVVIDRNTDAFPKVTKDGVTVARSVDSSDHFKSVGIKLMKQAAAKTAERAGDGTTASIVLAYNIYRKCYEALEQNYHPSKMKKGIIAGMNLVFDHIASLTTQIDGSEKLYSIANISSNGDAEIAQTLTECFKKIGKDGFVEIQNSPSYKNKTFYEFVEGISFPKTYVSPYFINERTKNKCVLDNPLIFLMDDKLHAYVQLRELLERLNREFPGRALLFICKDFAPDAIGGLVSLNMKGVFQICAVQSPSFGDQSHEILGDIAALTGATLISKASGKDLKTAAANVKIENLGTADQVTVSPTHTTITRNLANNEAIAARIEGLRAKISEAQDEEEIKFLQLRISQLSNGIALIRVGGATQAEVDERKDRVEDAMYAVKAALKSGVVPGAGTTLYKASSVVSKFKEDVKKVLDKDYIKGLEIIEEAVKEPLLQLLENAGLEKDDFVTAIKEDKDSKLGVDLVNEELVDLIEKGIIDPSDVVREAFSNAVSTAISLMTCECTIVDEKRKNILNELINPYNM